MVDRGPNSFKVGAVMTIARPQDKPSDARRPVRRLRLARFTRAGAGEAWARLVEAERRRAPLWAPVLVALGVWIYFALAAEPSVDSTENTEKHQNKRG